MSTPIPQPETAGHRIAAVVAAAGLSRRMGQPKQLLPWGDSTVLHMVISNLVEAGAAPVICVLGHLAQEIRHAVGSTPAICVENMDYRHGDMLSSYQTGINTLRDHANNVAIDGPQITGALLALSDQPHVPPTSIRVVIDLAFDFPDAIIIPSYAMRRGHPIYLPRRLWAALAELPHGATLRMFIQEQSSDIRYAIVESDAILRDMDTPQEYSARLDESGFKAK